MVEGERRGVEPEGRDVAVVCFDRAAGFAFERVEVSSRLEGRRSRGFFDQ